MNVVEAHCPGKLLLIGEYAILAGAPALVMAVPRRVRVRACAHAQPWCEVWAEPSGHWGRFSLRDGACQWHSNDASAAYFTVVRTVVAGLLGAAVPLPACRIEIDSTAFYRHGKKLGMGSSAAVCVALIAALRELAAAPHSCSQALLNEAVCLHRATQDGQGSGADVAASVLGGVLRLQMQEDLMQATATSWPKNLLGLMLCTGEEAHTASLIKHVHNFATEHPSAYSELMTAMSHAAALGSECFAAGDAAGFLSAADTFGALMWQLGQRSGAPIVTDKMARMAALARAHGAVAKPSGAGGGDVMLALSHSQETHRRVQQGLQAETIDFTALSPEPRGVTLVRQGDPHGLFAHS